MNMHKKIHVGTVVLYVIVVLLLLVQVYPIIWLFLSSLKTSVELTSRPFALPTAIAFDNYAKVFAGNGIFNYIKNTAIVTSISVIIIVILSSMVGFALEKIQNRLNKKLLTFFTIGIMIPIQVTLIPLFTMYKQLHLLNSYAALILPQVGFALPLSVLIFTNFYRYVPDQIIEASVIDGCNIYQTFLKIVMPLTKNTVITVASLNFILIWNDFVFSNTFTNDKKYKTIAVGLQDFIGAFGATDWGQTFAAICISLIPIFIIYLLLNKNVMSGISAGAVKE